MASSTAPPELILTQMLSMISADKRQTPTLQDVVAEQVEELKFEIARMQALSDQAVELLKGLKADVERLEGDIPVGTD